VKLCAVRETFEECGILLLEGKGKGKERWAAVKEAERRVWRDKVRFSLWCEKNLEGY
jgi:nucleoside diphosphate-linked moiety X motif protein 19